MNKILNHIIYWTAVILILVYLFGRSWGNAVDAFYFISLLLPVIMATSYFFNYFLVPKYLLKNRLLPFFLYSLYALVISLFLESAVLILTFTLRLEFDFGEMSRNASDTLLLGLVMYMIVFFTSILLLTRQVLTSQNEMGRLKKSLENLKEAQEDKESQAKQKDPILQVISQRKSVRIPIEEIQSIESFSDYIQFKLKDNTQIQSNERLNAIEKKLPGHFIRIHRSYIINENCITRFDYNEVELNGTVYGIGRSYKSKVLPHLKRCENPVSPLP